MKKHKYLNNAKIGLIIFLISGIAACKKESRWDCIKRTGEQTTDTRILPPFTNIYLKDNIDVFITQGAVQEVKIAAGKNLVSLIKTEVINGELYLSNDNKCNWARSYKKGTIAVYITLPTLIYIRHDGSGQIKSQNTLSCDMITIMTKESGDVELSVNATDYIYTVCLGSSDITLNGTTPVLGIYHISEGYLHFEDLKANDVWTESNASGNEYLNANNSLKATITWAGDVYYSGNPPTINAEIKGKGRLIQQN